MGESRPVKLCSVRSRIEAEMMIDILKQNQIHCWIDGYVFIHQATCFVNSDVVFTHSGNLIQTILSSGKENTLSEEDMERIKKVLGQ